MHLAPVLLTALATLGSMPATTQGVATGAERWTGKSVTLTRIGNRAMAAACPTLAKIDHFERVRGHKWDEGSVGCRFVLAGNFTAARVIEESGPYLRVRFEREGLPPTYTLWVPRINFRPVA